MVLIQSDGRQGSIERQHNSPQGSGNDELPCVGCESTMICTCTPEDALQTELQR